MAHVGLEEAIHTFLNYAIYVHLQCNNIKPVIYAHIHACLHFHRLWFLNGTIILLVTIIKINFIGCVSTALGV